VKRNLRLGQLQAQVRYACVRISKTNSTSANVGRGKSMEESRKGYSGLFLQACLTPVHSCVILDDQFTIVRLFFVRSSNNSVNRNPKVLTKARWSKFSTSTATYCVTIASNQKLRCEHTLLLLTEFIRIRFSLQP
jgi:hypothetical protein